jgi:hypothetical protein
MKEPIIRGASDGVEGWLATRRGRVVEVALEAEIGGEYALVMQAEGDLHRFRGSWYLAHRYQTHSGWRVGATFIDPTLLKPMGADVDGHDDCLSLALPSAVRLVLIDPRESGHPRAEASAG